MSPLQNSYIFVNLLINFLLKSFLQFFLYSNTWWLIDHPWKPFGQDKIYNPHTYHYEDLSDKLSARLDNELEINLKLSINFILPLPSFFLIGTEKVAFFSVLSPKHSNWP